MTNETSHQYCHELPIFRKDALTPLAARLNHFHLSLVSGVKLLEVGCVRKHFQYFRKSSQRGGDV